MRARRKNKISLSLSLFLSLSVSLAVCVCYFNKYNDLRPFFCVLMNRYRVVVIAVPAGGTGAIAPQVSKIWAKIFRAMIGKYLGKVKSFKALTLNNCKNYLPNLGEDLFFLEIAMISGRNFFFVRKSQTNFFSYP